MRPWWGKRAVDGIVTLRFGDGFEFRFRFRFDVRFLFRFRFRVVVGWETLSWLVGPKRAEQEIERVCHGTGR